MNKNTITGIIVLALLLLGWFGFNRYSQKQEVKRQEQMREQFVKDSLANPWKYAAKPEVEAAVADTTALQGLAAGGFEGEGAAQVQTPGLDSVLVAARSMAEKTYVMENDVMKVYISSRGAKVSNVELKDYKRYHKEGDGQPLMLFDENSAAFDLSFFIRKSYNYTQIHSGDYTFTTNQPQTIVSDGQPQTLALRLPMDGEQGAYIEYLYTIRPGEYMMDFDVRFVGMEEWTSTLTDFSMDWKVTTLQNEKGFKNENNNTDIAYKYPGDNKIEKLKPSEGTRSGQQNTKVEWLSFKQQYFSSAFIADGANSFSDVSYQFDTYKEGSGKIKDFSANFMVPYYPNQQQYGFQFYFGPNHYSTLRQYDLKLEKVIPLGGRMISWINTGFYIPVMNWLSKSISNWGIIILLMTLIVKLIILPLTYKSYKSSARMKALKPEIDAINAQFPGKEQADMVKKQQATMALYKQYGVSPMGGCLPMLIQMPIVFALFRFFPASIELRGQSFLWAEDLSAYDSILDLPFKIPFYGDHVSLFALLMAVSLYLYSRLNYNQTAQQGQQQQMAGMKFMMLYLMPVMMLCVMNSYSSGLSYYYAVSQLGTMGIMWAFRAFTNEDKLRVKMNEKAAKIASNPAKAAKKSGFRQRYEEALRQQQQQQRQQQQKMQGGSAKSHTAKPRSTNMQPPKKRK